LEDTTIEAALKTFQTQYMGGDYPNALITLNSLKTKMSEDLWHFNMGTVLGKMEQLPLARYHFVMAEMKGFNRKEIKDAQAFISEKLELQRLEKPLHTQDYLLTFGMTFTEGVFTSISLIFVVLGVWSIRKKAELFQIVIVFILALIPLGLDAWISNLPKSIVIETTPIYEAPTAIFGVKGELPAGVMVVTKVKEGWEYIIFPSRFSGWIQPSGLKPLEHR
jgi:hypothetical protein